MARPADGDSESGAERLSGVLPSKAQARATGARAVRAMRRGLAAGGTALVTEEVRAAASPSIR